jgi:hypothetical protein
MAKRQSLAERIAAAVPQEARRRSIPWHARLSQEQREQLLLIRAQYQAGQCGTSALEVARAIAQVAAADGFHTPTAKVVADWLREKTD